MIMRCIDIVRDFSGGEILTGDVLEGQEIALQRRDSYTSMPRKLFPRLIRKTRDERSWAVATVIGKNRRDPQEPYASKQLKED